MPQIDTMDRSPNDVNQSRKLHAKKRKVIQSLRSTRFLGVPQVSTENTLIRVKNEEEEDRRDREEPISIMADQVVSIGRG